MNVVLRTPDGDRDVTLDVAPGATVADLLAALALPPETPVWLDGVASPGGSPGASPGGSSGGSPGRSPGGSLDGLGDGSVVHLGCPPAAPPPAVVELAAVAGLVAGTRVPLGPGTHELGRGLLPSPTVSRRHASVTVAPGGAAAVRDAGSRNGTRAGDAWAFAETPLAPGDLLALGAVRLVARRPSPPPVRGRRTHNRPPRPAPPPPPAPLRVPAAAPSRGDKPRFSWATVFVPALAGAVMVVLLGSLAYAALTLLGPVLAVAQWTEERRRRRRDLAADARRVAEEVAAFGSALAAAREAARAAAVAAAPDLAALVTLAETAGARLWERRAPGPLAVGLGRVPWEPPLALPHEPAPGALDAVVPYLDDVPVTVPPGTVLGVTGHRAAALAVARALVCQAAVLTGPADLRVGVLSHEPAAWAWARWLPHWSDEPSLLVVDDPSSTVGRPAPVRDLLASGTVAAVVLAEHADDLPASCAHVLHVDADGAASLDGDGLLAIGAPEDVARRVALALARVDDPEAAGAARAPERVPLLPLLGPSLDLAARWHRADPDSLAVPVGLADGGPFVLDLVRDGPHALVAGTTGSGKSELLRTLVAALAATSSPEDLTFVLVDYKGGSAFAECAALPHVVGFVTDLDEHLGARALTCLEAELRHRERVLRDAAVPDLAAYAAAGRPHGPLPRLVVVVDEFATLAAELGDFVDSLVGIAQRGRSLGVHLVLATQRPSGAVNDTIRANTNLRIALRVTDAADSADVVGAPDAAALSRRHPGRGYARLGPGELAAFQAALVSTTTPDSRARVAVRPFGTPPPSVAADGPTDLQRLAAAARDAAAGLAPPRLPWPPPLPATVDLPDTPLPPDGVSAPLGLADEPSRQRQVPYEWAGGNLLLYGVAGSGTSTALLTLARSLARRYDPSHVHLYALDFGTAALAPLADLPHTGAVVQPPERDRQVRLVRHLRDEVARRRRLALEGRLAGLPHVVLLVDSWGAFEAAYDDVAGLATRDDLVRVMAEGPALGISTVATADRLLAVPMSVAALAPAKLLLRLADAGDYAAFGVRDVPPPVPGRAVDVATGREVQLALPPPPPPPRAHGPASLPAPIGALPDRVVDAGPATAPPAPAPWRVPVGVADSTLAPAFLTLRPGEPALVAGPARSGRSGLLARIAAAFRDTDVLVTAVAYRPSPLTCSPHVAGVVDAPAGLPELLAALDADPRRHLLLVDDAELVDDLGPLLAARRPGLRAVVAARADALRTAYGHWTDVARASRTGVLLRPGDADGDLLGVALPRRRERLGPGRGYLVADGDAELIQAVT